MHKYNLRDTQIWTRLFLSVSLSLAASRFISASVSAGDDWEVIGSDQMEDSDAFECVIERTRVGIVHSWPRFEFAYMSAGGRVAHASCCVPTEPGGVCLNSIHGTTCTREPKVFATVSEPGTISLNLTFELV